MHKNLSRYYQAWKLRQKGKKLREIGNIMGFGVERARILINYINMKIKYKKPISNKLKKLVQTHTKYPQKYDIL